MMDADRASKNPVTPASDDATVLVEVPARAKLYRRFHHSILIPFLRLDERSLENVAINPTDNDICLMAADICVSCFHFIEHAGHEDRELAGRLKRFPMLQLLSDIANTRKHLVRQKSGRQVHLIGRLGFEIADKLYGFIQTEVVAINGKGVEHDVHGIILDFINHVRNDADFGPPIALRPPRPRAYLTSCLLRLTYQTVAMEQNMGVFYRRNMDGSYRRAEGGLQVPIEVIPDISAEHRIGRFVLQHDIAEIHKWFEA